MSKDAGERSEYMRSKRDSHRTGWYCEQNRNKIHHIYWSKPTQNTLKKNKQKNLK